MPKSIYRLKIAVGGIMLFLFIFIFQEFRSTKDYGAQPSHVRESSSNSVGKTPCHTNFRMKQLSPRMDKLLCGKTTGKFKISQHLGDGSRFLSPSPCENLKG